MPSENWWLCDRRRLTTALPGLLLALAAGAASPSALLLDLRTGRATYTVNHKLHKVTGISQQFEGRALLGDDGTVKVQVRARVASFDSGNSNRDEHMRETVHQLEHPYVTIKGTLADVKLPLSGPLERKFRGTVELNGNKAWVDTVVKLAPDGAGVKVTYALGLSLEAFKIERPQLLLVKVDDLMAIEGEATFEMAK